MSNKIFDELSKSFDPDVWPVYSCVWNLYRHCDHYELSGDTVCWVFLLKKNLMPIFRSFMNPSSITKSTFVPVSRKSCSTVPSGLLVASLSPVTSRTFGEKCLIAFVPIAFLKRSRRRGGRKGRPKGTKTVPLGGSHL